jgi:hypothetical protein
MTNLLLAVTAEEQKIAYWDHIFQLAYPAYFTAFAIGAALMVLAVFLRRNQTDSRGRLGAVLFQGGLIVLLILCALSHQTTIDNNRGFIADEEKRYEKMIQKLEQRTDREEVLRAQYLYMPVGDSLAYMTLGNTGVAADYLWLTSMQYVSTSFRRGRKFELLNRFYTSMLEMDPHWIEAQVNAGKVLSALEPNRFAVEQFYIKAIVQNPTDWSLPYECGRLFVVPPMNLDEQPEYSHRAAEWFKTAMRRPTFPKQMIRATTNLLALVSAEAGYYEASDAMLYQQFTDEHSDINLREISARDWMNVHSIRMARELQKIVDEFKKANGRFPPDLPTLISLLPADAAAEFKEDAFGYPFEYDTATGKVASRGVKVRKALTVESVIASLIAMYRSDHLGKAPQTLVELRDWVRQDYIKSGNTASAGLKASIGSDLDPTRSPLGTWQYDAANGKIILPPWCTAEQLYRNTESVLKMGKLRSNAN